MRAPGAKAQTHGEAVRGIPRHQRDRNPSCCRLLWLCCGLGSGPELLRCDLGRVPRGPRPPALLLGLPGHVGPEPAGWALCSLPSKPAFCCGKPLSPVLSFLPRPLKGVVGVPLDPCLMEFNGAGPLPLSGCVFLPTVGSRGPAGTLGLLPCAAGRPGLALPSLC